MDPNMKELQEALVDIETDAEQVLLARHQVHMSYWLVLFIPDESLDITLLMCCSLLLPVGGK
jgi:hypothetical protein